MKPHKKAILYEVCKDHLTFEEISNLVGVAVNTIQMWVDRQYRPIWATRMARMQAQTVKSLSVVAARALYRDINNPLFDALLCSLDYDAMFIVWSRTLDTEEYEQLLRRKDKDKYILNKIRKAFTKTYGF